MRPPILVLDTNVWVSRQMLMLATPLAASLLFNLQRRGGKLGLPEVVEFEVIKQVRILATQTAQKFDDAASLLSDLGLHHVSEPEFELESVRAHATTRLEGLEPFLHRVPLTLEQAQRALKRVVADLPPNAPGNQQFKDSLIWEALVDLASEYDVTFVTGDKSFFSDRNFGQGLADPLRTEAADRGITVYSLTRIAEVLAQLSEGFSKLESEGLHRILFTNLMPRIEAAGKKWKFRLAERLHQHEAVFLTAHQGELAVDFKMSFAVRALERDVSERRGQYRIDGSCLYLVEVGQIRDLSISSESISLDNLNEGTYRLQRDVDDDYVGPRMLI